MIRGKVLSTLSRYTPTWGYIEKKLTPMFIPVFERESGSKRTYLGQLTSLNRPKAGHGCDENQPVVPHRSQPFLRA